MAERRCPVCGGELVTVYKTFEVDGKDKVENVPVIMCPKCNISLVNTDLLINITERSKLENKDEILEELKEAKTDEEIRNVLEQYKAQNHIREILNEKKLSYHWLAYILGVSSNYIRDIATNNRSIRIKTALKIAYALGVNISELYTLEKENKNTDRALVCICKITEDDKKLKEELKRLNVKIYIEDVLKEKGLQKIQLARRLGIAKASLYKILNITKENMQIETGLKIAYALGVDINRIFTLE
ncbi:helix-turn-helix domain-containing protein [Thermoanaerobacterium sp. RBIITD]|uniref:helix-turn-helix domain-containing protein n=1 Tax=Thermoanaerobacterium sp. RBIITD TaxID=1550240 RepID=UPI000BB95AEA|nr:helix-turn-helix domain-containing protein [Thermoanaerobacterium sp. RBIITD]SNX54141.1 Helix-turn-helix [Thermoanaerobacterium sp. RBIITD]